MRFYKAFYNPPISEKLKSHLSSEKYSEWQEKRCKSAYTSKDVLTDERLIVQ